MLRKVIIALARHGVTFQAVRLERRTPRRAPGHIDYTQALGAANGMGYGGVGKCVIPDDDNNPQGKFAGDRCQAVWTTDDSAACEVDQYGCPSVACDGSDKPWCMMEDGLNWCYCE